MLISHEESGVGFVINADDTGELAEIMLRILPSWAELFAEKNRKYAGLAGNDLGVKGKFVDVYRKTMLLKSRIWDGHEVVGENNVEVIMDMIGHLFLMLNDMVAREEITITERSLTGDKEEVKVKLGSVHEPFLGQDEDE